MDEIKLRRYKPEQRIGEGGMGLVYKAYDTNKKGYVALKFLTVNISDKEAVERFRREAEILTKLEHPNIIAILDYGMMQDVPFIVLEYCDGFHPSGFLLDKELGMSQAQVRNLAHQVCEALEYAHSRNVVHRDIKPDNILNTNSGRYKLNDFGLAKCVEEEDAPKCSRKFQTKAGILLGTPAYMPPEFLSDEVNPKSDIYSLGIMMFELLEGYRPFKHQNVLELLHMHCIKELPAMKNAGELEGLVRWCCEKKHEKRPSAQDVLANLSS